MITRSGAFCLKMMALVALWAVLTASAQDNGASISPLTIQATTTVLTATSNGTSVSSVASNTVVTLTAQVRLGQTPVKTGLVKFCDANVAYCSDIHLLGTAQLTAAGTAAVNLKLGLGTHNIKAVFSGTAAYSASASGAWELSVFDGPTLTNITESGSVGNYTLSATVNGSGSEVVPTGSVEFLDTTNGGNLLGSFELENGAWTQSFSAQSTYLSGHSPQSVAVGDFNGDGIPDLVVANDADDTISILIGYGDGSYGAQSQYLTGYGPSFVTVGDFNGDGIEDLAVTNYGSSTVSIYIGTGFSTFHSQVTYAAGGSPRSIATADVNRDGIADLVVTNELKKTVSVLLGRGDGTFKLPVSYPVGNLPLSVAVGDLNGDGIADLVVANNGDNNVGVLLGKGDGTFNAQTTYAVGSGPYFVTLADLNSDGVLDMAVANYNGNTVSVLLGKGDGTFNAQSTYATGSVPVNIAIGDFKGNGIPDLAVANFYGASVSVLMGVGDGTFQPQVNYAVGNGPSAVAASDLNGDGVADLAVTNWNDQNVGVLLNEITTTTSGTVSGVSVVRDCTEPHSIEGVYSGDSLYQGSTSSYVQITADPCAATPTFSPAAGTYTTAQTVSISVSTPGSAIFYTLDGTTPTTGSLVYTAPIQIASSATVKAVAIASGYSLSNVGSVKYTINYPADTPTFSPAPGTYTSVQKVAISDTTQGATIYYTTDGSTPTTSSMVYSAPITVSTSETIEAIAIASGYSLSNVAGASYTINLPAATPAFSPVGGTYTSAQNVAITCATPGATIYYTTDGSTPTTSSAVYAGPISVTATETLSAVAIAGNYSLSSVASATYTIHYPTATPTFSPAGGTFTSTQTVTISDATAGATIYYTTNGTTPTTSSAVYTGPLTVSASETIEAIALATGYSQSAVGSAVYTINMPVAATPTFSPAGGTYSSTQTVTISDATAGATLYYTTNGTTPTTNSTVYTGPLTVSASETLKAIAGAAGYTQSVVASAMYTITSQSQTTATPVFSPPGGTYSTTQTVTITDATAGATIYYTTNGTTPTANSTVYTGAITVSSSKTIKAIALASGYKQSAVASATYTITGQAATPVFTPAGGTYKTSVQVRISDATPKATIYYTTDGSTPTTSSKVYSGTITVSKTETIAAIAVATGYTQSAVASASYTIN